MTFQIPYADGHRDKLSLRDQLVLASYALRERASPDEHQGSART